MTSLLAFNRVTVLAYHAHLRLEAVYGDRPCALVLWRSEEIWYIRRSLAVSEHAVLRIGMALLPSVTEPSRRQRLGLAEGPA